MTTLVFIFVGTVVFAIWNGRLIRKLADCYSQKPLEWPVDRPLPKAAVILSLRGHDPFLQQCLRNLIGQNYPDFQIYLVVDSEADPAWDAIHEVQREFPHKFVVATLQNRRSNCSLKNSSIIQAVNSLPGDVEVVALVDADAVVAPTWLRNLVLPLANPEIGCTTGIRWFAPVEQTFANRLRCYWNHIAASMIYASNIPWGGSMAVRRSILDSGLTDEWSRMFCEDAHTINHLNRRGIGLAHVPDATIPNQENVSVVSCIRFINRQMLIFRLYNPNWTWLVFVTFLAAALRIAHDVLIIRALLMQEFLSALLLIAIHPLVLLVIRYEAGRLDQIVRQRVKENGQDIAPNPLPTALGYFCVEIVFLTSMLTALFTRFALWRGIEYRIRGPENITLIEYKPYQQPGAVIIASDSTVV